MPTTETDKTYQGWKNHSTWLVALHFANDEALYSQARSAAKMFYNQAMMVGKDKETAAVELSKWLRRIVEVNNPFLKNRILFDELHKGGITVLYADLLNSAIADTNWYEIALSWIEDFAE